MNKGRRQALAAWLLRELIAVAAAFLANIWLVWRLGIPGAVIAFFIGVPVLMSVDSWIRAPITQWKESHR